MSTTESEVAVAWTRIAAPDIDRNRVTTIVLAGRAVCMAHLDDGSWSALDNRCPHQGRPARGGADRRRLPPVPVARLRVRPSHRAAAAGVRRRGDAVPSVRVATDDPAALEVQLPVEAAAPSLMDQLVHVLCEWGLVLL